MPNGETTQSIIATEAGNIQLQLPTRTDESSSADIEITDDLPEPIVTADGPLSFCDGSSVTWTSLRQQLFLGTIGTDNINANCCNGIGYLPSYIINEEGCRRPDPIQVVNDNPADYHR